MAEKSGNGWESRIFMLALTVGVGFMGYLIKDRAGALTKELDAIEANIAAERKEQALEAQTIVSMNTSMLAYIKNAAEHDRHTEETLKDYERRLRELERLEQQRK